MRACCRRCRFFKHRFDRSAHPFPFFFSGVCDLFQADVQTPPPVSRSRASSFRLADGVLPDIASDGGASPGSARHGSGSGFSIEGTNTAGMGAGSGLGGLAVAGSGAGGRPRGETHQVPLRQRLARSGGGRGGGIEAPRKSRSALSLVEQDDHHVPVLEFLRRSGSAGDV